MIDLPTTFDELKGRRSSDACWILQLTDGSDTFYYARKVIEFPTTNEIVEPYVLQFPAISQVVDPLKGAANPLNIEVVLAGQWSGKKTTGEWRQLIDVIAGVWGRDCDIIWYPGSYTRNLSDCATIFQGTVTELELAADETIVLRADERTRWAPRQLPQRLADTTEYPKIPHDRRNIPMPLVYGDYDEGATHHFRGLAPCELVDSTDRDTAKYLIADHPMANLQGFWFFMDSLDSWAEAIGGTFTTDASDADDRATVEVDFPNLEFYVYLYPTSGDANALDHDIVTKAEVIATSTTEASIVFAFGQNGSSIEEYIDNGVAQFVSQDTGTQICQLYKTLEESVSAHAVEVWTGSAWTSVDTATTVGSIYDADFDGSYSMIDGGDGCFWHLGEGPKGDTTTEPFRVRVKFTGSGWTAGTTVVGYVHFLRLRVWAKQLPNYPMHRSTGGPMIRSPRPNQRAQDSDKTRIITYPYYFPAGGFYWYFDYKDAHTGSRPFWSLDGRVGVEGEGRMFGAWVDDLARDNTFNENDTIAHPAGIIESLLRDEIGLDDDTIDVDSFDAAYNAVGAVTVPVLNVSLPAGQTVSSDSLINSIANECGYWVFWSTEGKVKIVDPLDSVATARVITWEDIDGIPAISFGRVHDIANEFTFQYGTPNTAPDGFMRQQTCSDSTSQTNYGARAIDITLPDAMEHDDAERAVSFYCDDTSSESVDGLLGWLSRRRERINFLTIGPAHADLDIGDRIELTAAEFDEMFPLPGDGSGWDGHEFIIYGKQLSETGIRFQAISRG